MVRGKCRPCIANVSCSNRIEAEDFALDISIHMKSNENMESVLKKTIVNM